MEKKIAIVGAGTPGKELAKAANEGAEAIIIEPQSLEELAEEEFKHAIQHQFAEHVFRNEPKPGQKYKRSALDALIDTGYSVDEIVEEYQKIRAKKSLLPASQREAILEIVKIAFIKKHEFYDVEVKKQKAVKPKKTTTKKSKSDGKSSRKVSTRKTAGPTKVTAKKKEKPEKKRTTDRSSKK